MTRFIIRRLVDRSDLLDDLAAVDGVGTAGRGAWAERALGRADEARRPEPGGRKTVGGKLPASRDFR